MGPPIPVLTLLVFACEVGTCVGTEYTCSLQRSAHKDTGVTQLEPCVHINTINMSTAGSLVSSRFCIVRGITYLHDRDAGSSN